MQELGINKSLVLKINLQFKYHWVTKLKLDTMNLDLKIFIGYLFAV